MSALTETSQNTAPGGSALTEPFFREGSIARVQWSHCDRRAYVREHLNSLKPAIVLGAIDHWPAREKWTPRFFKEHYGWLNVKVGGKTRQLGELVDEILASTPEHPALYLHNQLIADWPPELSADISPMPECTRPNYLESRLFPARVPPIYPEFYMGGPGAAFPTVHYDNLHTHAFLMQLYGRKEYLVFPPGQARFLYPRTGIEANKSSIPDIENVDLSRFPLYAEAEGTRLNLDPGETLFVPAGWWHTARILTTSITVSINGANAGNWAEFRRDFCAGIARRSPLKAALIAPYLAFLGALFSISQP